MTQIPRYFGARYPAVSRRTTHAMALWRARDGMLAAATDDTPITFTSTGGGVYRMAKDAMGRMYAIPENLPNTHMLDLDGDGFCESPVLQMSTSDGNRIASSEAFGSWTANNTPAILSPTLKLGDLTLSLLSDTNATLQAFYSTVSSNSGLDARSCVSVFIGRGNINAAGGSGITVYDNTAAAVRAQGVWTWTQQSNGIWRPNVTVATGQLCALEYCGRHWYQHQTTKLKTFVDVWRLTVRVATSFVNTNSNQVRVYPAFTAAQQGNEFFGGVMMSKFPSSYVKTVGSVLTPGSDSWRMAFSGVPQAMTLAVRLVYTGFPSCYVSGQSGLLVALSDAALALPRLGIFLSDSAGGAFYSGQIADGVNPALNVNLATTPTPGDVVLIRLALRDDGSLVIGQRINGGVETTVTSGNPYGVPAAWAANSAIRLVDGATGGEQYLAVGVFAGEPSASYIEAVME